jgi:hypothetical protein
MNYKRLKDWESGLANQIVNRFPKRPNAPTGFVERAVTGEPGIGKSTYVYKVMAKVDYILKGYERVEDEEEAYKFALNGMIYHPRDFADLIYNNKRNRTISPVICLDDASVHFGKQMYRLDPDTYMEIEGLIPTLRTAVTGFLITTPYRRSLAKFLREFCRHSVNILQTSDFDSYQRMARQYEKYWYPDDQKFRMRIPFQDEYSCFIPEPYYTWYYEKKMKAEEEYAEMVSRRQNYLRSKRDKKNWSNAEQEV